MFCAASAPAALRFTERACFTEVPVVRPNKLWICPTLQPQNLRITHNQNCAYITQAKRGVKRGAALVQRQQYRMTFADFLHNTVNVELATEDSGLQVSKQTTPA